MHGEGRARGEGFDLISTLSGISPVALRTDAAVAHAMNVVSAVMRSDSRAFIRLYRDAPFMSWTLMDFMWWRVRSGAIERMAAAYMQLPVHYICKQTGLEFDVVEDETAEGNGKGKGKGKGKLELGPMVTSLLRHVDVEPTLSAGGWSVDFASAKRKGMMR